MDSFLDSVLTVDIILAWMLWCDSAAMGRVRTMGSLKTMGRLRTMGSVRTMGNVRTMGSVRIMGSVRTKRAVGCHRSGILFDNMIFNPGLVGTHAGCSDQELVILH